MKDTIQAIAEILYESVNIKTLENKAIQAVKTLADKVSFRIDTPKIYKGSHAWHETTAEATIIAPKKYAGYGLVAKLSHDDGEITDVGLTMEWRPAPSELRADSVEAFGKKQIAALDKYRTHGDTYRDFITATAIKLGDNPSKEDIETHVKMIARKYYAPAAGVRTDLLAAV